MIRSFDDDGVSGGDVDPGFDNGGTHQHVKTLMVEIVHHAFQFALAHLSVTDTNTRFRHQFSQPVSGFLDVFDVVKQIINLSPAQNFTQDRLAYHQVVVFAHEGFDRQTTSGWCGDNRQIAHAAHCHIERTWNRRCRQGQNIDICAHRLDAFFVANAETVLFIDNQQTQIF